MFSCSACLRRAVSSLSADLSSSHASPGLWQHGLPRSLVPYRTTSPSRNPPIRTTTTLRSIKKGHHRQILIKALQRNELPPPNKRRNRVAPTKVEQRDRLARENNANHLATPEESNRIAAQAAKEAHYLVDPLRLAQEVQRNLQNDGFDKALALVRASEKQGLIDGKKRGQVNNIVSWNHLCDHAMAHGDTRLALKIYNEMKKRGHRSDAHTYTIMLRGFGNNVRKPNAVADAMKVYNSMFEPNSGLKPNTIHNNAIISVCARGGKMDELWSVAGRLPDRGMGQADHVTYSIIIKALQRNAIEQAATLMAQEVQGGMAGNDAAGTIFHTAAEDGRKLWRDVIMKWRRADLRLDESLICAMGRLLLLGKRRKDILDVFRLVEQTMGIKIPKNVAVESETNMEELESSQTAVTVFNPVPGIEQAQDTNAGVPSAIYVQPGQNTLSMLLEASLLSKTPHIGKAYWWKLTNPANQNTAYIAPDSNNVTSYLRLLRFSRASKEILDLLKGDWPRDLAKELHRRGTYVIAMSTCVRDKNNPNVFGIASQIVDLMAEHTLIARSTTDPSSASTDDPKHEDDEYDGFDETGMAPEAGLLDVDPKVLAMYLNLAMFTTPGVNPRLPLEEKTKDGKIDFARKNNTLDALRRMAPDTLNVKRLLSITMAEIETKRNVEVSQKRRGELSAADRRMLQNSDRSLESLEDLVGLGRAMISAYDRLIAINLVSSRKGGTILDKSVLNDIRLQRAKMSTLMGNLGKTLNPEGERRSRLRIKDAEKKEDDFMNGRGETGVWHGYNANATTRPNNDQQPSHLNTTQNDPLFSNSNSKVNFNNDAEDETLETDTFLLRTPTHARLNREIKRKSKALEPRPDEQRGWSRRMTQEAERDRRDHRVRKLRDLDVKNRLGRVVSREGEKKERGFGRRTV